MNGVKTDGFIEANMGLVHMCANRFRGKGIEYDDLFSTGCIGLIKAANAFDETRGVKFSTYAVPVILGEIKGLFRNGGTVKVGRALKELSVKVSRERERFFAENGREPLLSELAENCGETTEAVAEAIAAGLPVLSLTQSSDDESDTGQTDVAVDAPENELTEMLSLHQALLSLEKDEQNIIFLRYYKGLTQTETAEKLHTSQVQISRKEKKLLMKLRKFLNS
jgi:RNA polymerase sporulation-specific sigma factor